MSAYLNRRVCNRLICLLVMWGMNLMQMQDLVAQVPDQHNDSDAQERIACPKTAADLYLIEQLFEAGQFTRIAGLKGCCAMLYETTMGQRQSTPELLSVTERFLHLYVLSNLALEHNEEARWATTLLLECFPQQRLNPDLDPPQFKVLLDSLVPFAVNHFGLYGGTNVSLLQVASPTQLLTDITVGGPVRTAPEFDNRLGFAFGLEWQRHFAYRHSLLTGIGISAVSFSTRYASRAFDGKKDAIDGDWSLQQIERYSFLQVPLNYQYRLPLTTARDRHQAWLGFHGGVYGALLFHAETELETVEYATENTTNGAQIVGNDRRSTTNSPLGRRKLLSAGLCGGVTYQADYAAASFYLRLSLQWGLSQLRKEGTEYGSAFSESIWEYHVSDQNFKLHNLQFTVGVLLPKTYRVKNFYQHTR